MTRRERNIGVALLACMAVVLFWEIMAVRSVRPWDPFRTKAVDFEGFAPVVPGWETARVPVSEDPVEPNILAFKLVPTGSVVRASFLVRLAHGYNMPECMKIKGFQVHEVEGVKGGTEDGKTVQVWKVVDSIGNGATWITSLIRAGDFEPFEADIRTIAFPRVGIPDEPGREEDGISWGSLKRPFSSLRVFFRAKWNASRCDVATFLKLRQPAWASGEVLAIVTAVTAMGGGVDEGKTSGYATEAAMVQESFRLQLRDWGRIAGPQ